MKALPYYRMYPKDFDTDEAMRLLDVCESGVYLWCLNHAWVNDGIPSDPEEIQRALKLPAAIFRKLWPRVSKCFMACEDGRLRSKRQEEERAIALNKSVKAADSVRSRWETKSERNTEQIRTYNERMPNVIPRVLARAESDSVSGSVFEFDVDFFEGIWKKWKRQRRDQPMQLVVQLVSGRDGFDWREFSANAPVYIAWCEAMRPEPWKYCSLTLWEWIEGGMILPPESKQYDPLEGI